MCDQAQKQFTADSRPIRLLLISDDGHFSNAFTLTVESRLNISVTHVSSLRAAAVMLEAGRRVDLMLVDGRQQTDIIEQASLFRQSYGVLIVVLSDESKTPLHLRRMAVVHRDDTEGALSAIVYGLTVGF